MASYLTTSVRLTLLETHVITKARVSLCEKKGRSCGNDLCYRLVVLRRNQKSDIPFSGEELPGIIDALHLALTESYKRGDQQYEGLSLDDLKELLGKFQELSNMCAAVGVKKPVS